MLLQNTKSVNHKNMMQFEELSLMTKPGVNLSSIPTSQEGSPLPKEQIMTDGFDDKKDEEIKVEEGPCY